MTKLNIILAILIVTVCISLFQWSRMGNIRADIRELRSSLEEPSASQTSGTGSERNRTTQRDANRLEAERVQRSEPVNGRRHPDGTTDASDELRLEQLVERLGLDARKRGEMAPLLRKFIRNERVATSELIDAASEMFSGEGNYDEFIGALRRRSGLSDTPDSLEVRNRLTPAQELKLDDLESEQEENLLQLLADRDFGGWQVHLDFGTEESKQAAYKAFYLDWKRRLDSPPEEGLSAREAEAVLEQDREAILEAFADIIPEAQLDLMRQIYTAGHEYLLQRREQSLP